MGILSNLEPKRVFEIFEEMCAIPHGSTNTKAISDWCVAFGEKLGLEHYQDEANNVILIAPATPGYEDAPAVILQGHVDMVCEKEAGCAKDMDKEGLDLFVDGDLVGAKGTTLGGDDGIAVAMALAALSMLPPLVASATWTVLAIRAPYTTLYSRFPLSSTVYRIASVTVFVVCGVWSCAGSTAETPVVISPISMDPARDKLSSRDVRLPEMFIWGPPLANLS